MSADAFASTKIACAINLRALVGLDAKRHINYLKLIILVVSTRYLISMTTCFLMSAVIPMMRLHTLITRERYKQLIIFYFFIYCWVAHS